MWIKRFFLGLCAAVCAYLAVVMVTVMVRRGQDPSMELTALEEQWADWEPPAPKPVLCWMGYVIPPWAGGDYQCQDGKPQYRPAKRWEKSPRIAWDGTSRLAWPVIGLITTHHGEHRRKERGWRKTYNHVGIDIDCEMGDPIRAAIPGLVVEARSRNGWGNSLVISAQGGDDLVQVRNSHLRGFAVREGELVERGQIVGYCGNTGYVKSGPGGDGTHLDFEVYVGNQAMDPESLLPR